LRVLKQKGGDYECENIAQNPGHTFAGVAKSCPRSEGQLCRGCINMNQNWGKILQGLQKPAPDLRETFAGVAETRPRTGGRFCRGCRNPPQNWGKILQGLHKPAPEQREDFARVA
jgi:hypothetical protein